MAKSSTRRRAAAKNAAARRKAALAATTGPDEPQEPTDDTDDVRGLPAGGPLPAAVVAWLMVIAGALGLWASIDLTLERYRQKADPNHIAICDFNSVFSCSSVMKTPEAELFGFPNSIFGIAAYAVVALLGVGMLLKRRYPRWLWWGFMAGNVLGLVFMHVLVFFSAFKLGALCPFCMLVWVVTIPLALYTFFYAAGSGELGLKESARARITAIADFHPAILIGWFGVIALIVGMKFI